jgi:hypothetical protein
MESIKIKCTKCKVMLPKEHYNVKRNGDLTKNCSYCLQKRKESVIKNKCIHNIRKDYCVECNGAGICKHKRDKYACKECNGSQICVHNRIRKQCKECKGSQICVHDRIKQRCKECKGTSIWWWFYL